MFIMPSRRLDGAVLFNRGTKIADICRNPQQLKDNIFYAAALQEVVILKSDET